MASLTLGEVGRGPPPKLHFRRCSPIDCPNASGAESAPWLPPPRARCARAVAVVVDVRAWTRTRCARIEADEALRALAREASARNDGDAAHDGGHLMRVALWTLRLADATVEPRSAIAAALLHDLVNVPKSSPDRARTSALCAEAARPLLAAQAFDARAIEEIAEAIEDHSYSRGATPRSALGRALQDADRLEALGAIGIARCFATGARMGARFFDERDPWARARTLDDRHYSVDHFFAKLLELGEAMQTEAGRAEAERRIAVLEAFLDALAEEIGAPRPPDG